MEIKGLEVTCTISNLCPYKGAILPLGHFSPRLYSDVINKSPLCRNTRDCLCVIPISPIPTNIKFFFPKFPFSCLISKSSQKDLQEMMHSGLKLPSKLEVGEDSHDGHEK